MSHQPQPDRNLSEISHLFLSEVRERATGGSSVPQRRPPQDRREESVDLTEEELAQVFGGEPSRASHEVPVGEVTAVIASHLSGRPLERVKQYARHLASDGDRIGLIEVGASEFRLMCFEQGGSHSEQPLPLEVFDVRRMREAIDELCIDVDRWLLLVPSVRAPEGRTLLREVRRWVLLSTTSHDGVVGAYRSLKGLSSLWSAQSRNDRPRLSLAVLDADDEDHAGAVHARLSSACRQFLEWPLDSEAPVRPAADVAEHLVMLCSPTRDKTQVAAAPQWQIVSELVARSKRCPRVARSKQPHEEPALDRETVRKRLAPEVKMNQETVMPRTIAPSSRPVMSLSTSEPVDEVMEIEGELDERAILSAVLRREAGELVECPLVPPAHPLARLAVDRERRAVLLAVAREGLRELASIGQAMRWLIENVALVALAKPQLAIDPTQPPRLVLLVSHRDATAHLLQPVLQSAQVTVQIYRAVKWSGRRGLLLEAA